MTRIPQVSIVVPLFNDEEFVASAIRSCLTQTCGDVEVICVDDASTDGTTGIVEQFATADPRVRLIQQPENRSAFQARRVGILAARAPFILFLDGDDELAPSAVRSALEVATKRSADVVGFGVDIVSGDSPKPRRFEAALQPEFDLLVQPAIVPALFPAGEVANGHLWRYLFDVALLRRAYEGIPDDLSFYRANDLPITLLALAYAKRYASTRERLYRYHFRRGTSGHQTDSVERFAFLASGVKPITSIRASMLQAATQTAAPASLMESYESARLHIVGNILHNWVTNTPRPLQEQCFRVLRGMVSDLDIIRSAAAFCKDALEPISRCTIDPDRAQREVKSVLVMSAHLDTGGLQSVLIDQATRLSQMGYKVTIGVLRKTNREISLPPEIEVVVFRGSLSSRLEQLVELCESRAIDVIIDHHVLYNDRWPWFALAGIASGVPTIAWLHNFGLRPIFDRTTRISFIAAHAHLLLHLVTLSNVDVALWKLLGVPHVVYLPNPPSDLVLAALEIEHPRSVSGRLELAWWGRLDATTKQVDHLLSVAAHLATLDVDFRLRIIGPDSKYLTAVELTEMATSLGVADRVTFRGGLDQDALSAELADAHVLVSTSAIEGYQLTILEAQSMGMPVVMYDLPWLMTVRDNEGLIRIPQSDPTAMAQALADLASDAGQYATLSGSAREFARSSTEVDINQLLVGLLEGTLSSQWSPKPTLEDARILVPWLVRYSERSIAEPSPADAARISSELRDARNKLRHLTSGPSYKIGRLVTAAPRAVRAFAKRAMAASRKAS